MSPKILCKREKENHFYVLMVRSMNLRNQNSERGMARLLLSFARNITRESDVGRYSAILSARLYDKTINIQSG